MEEKEIIKNDDIEVLNVNKELIKQEKHNGFKVKKNYLWMFVKNLPANVYKLTVLLLATIADYIPNIVSKVPIIGYGVDALRALGTQYFTQVTSDEVFDTLICPMFNIPVGFEHNEYNRAFAEFTHHKGEYFKYSLLIKTVAQFAMEHPALIIAGGAAILGLGIKLVETLVKKTVRKVRFNKMNKKQQEIYLLLKDILKKARKIKKAENGKILVKDLNITYDIVNYLGEYVDMLDNIHNILSRLQQAIENKNETEYERCRLDLETSVFNFDMTHGNILNQKMNLIENPPKKEKENKQSKGI